MKIKSMTATFGRLDKARLEPGPGLTLIYAPNEGGKSTWAAFWRAMLYGIDTRSRDKKGFLADKNRYQPWSGAPMEGEMELELEGRDITIRRGPRGNTPFGSFSAVYSGTQEPVPGLTAANCGELLTGVGAEVFTRSAFLGDGNLSLTSAPELERRIAALASSGEEDVSFSQTMARLKEWRNRRQVNRSVGEIPRLEHELAQVQEVRIRQTDILEQIARLEGERSALEHRRDSLNQQLEAHKAIARRQLSDRYLQAEEAYQTASRQLAALETECAKRSAPEREELKRAQGELQYIKVLEDEIRQGEPALKEAEERSVQAAAAARDELFDRLTGEEAVAKTTSDCAAYQAMQEKAQKFQKTCPVFLIIGFLWLLCISVPFFLKNGVNYVSILGFAVFLVFVLLTCLQKKRVSDLKNNAAQLLACYGVQTPEEAAALARDYQSRCQAAEMVARQTETLRTALADRKSKRETSRAGLLDFVHQFAPEVKDMFGCSAALSRALNLEHELSLARERTEERRRRLDDLAAQGGRSEAGDGPEVPVPGQGPEETAQALAQTAAQLEQVDAQLNQARGLLQASGDPAALAARQEELEEALSRRALELDAITIAMDTLTQANARLQERFSPELNRLTGQYMARLTGNKYQTVSLTRELEGFVQSEGGVLPHSALYLSRGTAGQLYLALRLAVCRLCLPEKPPILLDDALTAFDDQRLVAALELLWELSGEQQLLLFTCQKREGEVLASTPGVTKLEL